MIQSGYVRYAESLRDDLVPIDSVRQHPDNANNGDVDEIMMSIETGIMYHSATTQQSTGYILRGNHTWLACKQMSATVFPIKPLTPDECDDTLALKILMGDNKIANLAMMDRGQELTNLYRLQEADAIIGSGYKDADIEHLAAIVTKPLVPDDFTQPWKLMCFQVPPETEATFMEMTETAGGMRERFEMLLRLANQG